MKDYPCFVCLKMEALGNLHQHLGQQDMKNKERPQVLNLDLLHSLEQRRHLSPGGISGMQTKHNQPDEQKKIKN